MPLVIRTLLEMTVAAGAMIIAVFAVRACLSKKMNPVVMAVLWAAVLARLCLPLMLDSPVHVTGMLPQQAATVLQALGEAPAAALPGLAKTAAQPPNGTPASEAPKAGNAAAPNTVLPAFPHSAPFSVSVWDLLIAIWAAGALAVLALALQSAARFRRKLSICRPVTHRGVLRSVRLQSASLGIRRPVTVLECNFVQVPTVFGCFWPRMLLPKQFLLNMDERLLDGVLLHELCHIKRNDILVSCLWLLAKAAHWFNPLVWLAYRAYQYDNELCLDQMVLHRMGEGARLDYSQSLIDSVRLARREQSPLPPVLASLFKNESKVKERVTRMVYPRKKSKLSLLATSLLAVLMLAACFTTACRPVSPDAALLASQPPAADKSSAAPATPAPTSTPPAMNEFANYAKTWSDTVTVKEHPITVNINATVVTPNTDKLPVYEILPDKLTQDQVNSFLGQFGNAQYRLDTDIKTKDYYQKEIERMQAELAKVPDNKEYTDAQKKEQTQGYEYGIENFKKFMQDAPVSIDDVVEPVFTNKYIIQRDSQPELFAPEPSATPDTSVHRTAREEYESTHTEAIQVKWQSGGSSLSLAAERSDRLPNNLFHFFSGQQVSGHVAANASDLKGFNTTYSKARSLAQEAVAKLGLDYAKVAESAKIVIYPNLNKELNRKDKANFTDFSKLESADIAYVFYFTRAIGNVAETYCSNFMFVNQTMEPWPYVRLYVIVDDSGIREINLDSTGSKLGNKLTDDSKLLPFEQITKIAAEQFGKGNIDFSSSGFNGTEKEYKYLQKMDLDIDRAVLGYARVRTAPDADSYKMVPAWDFFGSYAYNSTIDPANPWNMYSKEMDSASSYDHSFLTINAVDGSVIDRSMGN